MELETFLAKVNRDDTIQKTGGARGSECGRIVRLVRAAGYLLPDLEGHTDYPLGITSAWNRGREGVPMGVHSTIFNTGYELQLCFVHTAGRRYQRSQQQAGVSPEVEPVGQPTRVAPSTVRWTSWYPDGPRFAVGSTSTDTQSGQEPERTINNGDFVSVSFSPAVGSTSTDTQSGQEPESDGHPHAYYVGVERCIAGVRSPLNQQEGRVPSVRDEREGSERGEEDPLEPFIRSLERSTGRQV